MALSLNPALDVNYLTQIYGDDASIVQIIFEAFLSDSLPRWKSLKSLIEDENIAEAASVVHGIKPSFTMAGLTGIRLKVEALERDIHDEVETKEIVAHYLRINEDVERIIPILEEEAEKLGHLAS
ncbi:Hpt domain-containing protein [Dyadobacter koreensis]|uniref:Hpt domain-containing protein n=1 Tax=Dyadobacter koreensis TaxID=408657 RepID=A0A1H6VG78_9BACT|nr:Hpt domain-containing protein [Dyadobacter koreensis]SEI99342.1 Hpt domain-containing protein [Dyadobacter koreensis]